MKKIVLILMCCARCLYAGEHYGTWNSPISAETITQSPGSADNLQIDGSDTYWVEGGTIVRLSGNGRMEAASPSNFIVRSLVHEYGGGAYTVSNGVIYASNGEDNAIYIIKPRSAPRRLTNGDTRFADLHMTPYGLVAVGEYHGSNHIVQNFLALINTQTGQYKKIASGYDFYSSPTISADGKKIAWICWNHPNMPWTNTELWMAQLTPQGEIINRQQIGGSIEESFFQPQWSPDGTLYFVTDRDQGFWNLHRYRAGHIENVCPMKAEVGEPLWTFDLSTYAFLGNQIIFTYNEEGRWYLASVDPETKKWKKIETEGTYLHQLRKGRGCVEFFEEYSDKGEALMRLSAQPGRGTTVRLAKPASVDKGYISVGQHIAYPSDDRTAYAFYYPPQNKNYSQKSAEKPPLIVMLHGGPTAQAKNSLNLETQFWTSRGFAVLDVNYGGSTGYGREYRGLLDHQWGVVDVEDCVNGALFLVQKGLVDEHKLIIRGGSAGGYTTLAALAFTDTFSAGASYYGISDITALARDTHKFEKKYMEQLVGKYPENQQLWEKRSPINSVNSITAPLILFQGDKDPIVPKNQAIMIYDALKKRGVLSELHIYPNEEHGFRQEKNYISSLKREAEFYLEALS